MLLTPSGWKEESIQTTRNTIPSDRKYDLEAAKRPKALFEKVVFFLKESLD